MKALAAAARAICYATAGATDKAAGAADPKERAEADKLVALLTPVAKAFSTDIGTEVASTGVQVHGGMGYIEETGAAQHFRDARIAQIYEGTNGIQAIDLVTRKLPIDGGRFVLEYVASLRETADTIKASNRPEFGGMAGALARWITKGDPGFDLSAFSLKRFGPEHNKEAFLRQRVRHAHSTH